MRRRRRSHAKSWVLLHYPSDESERAGWYFIGPDFQPTRIDPARLIAVPRDPAPREIRALLAGHRARPPPPMPMIVWPRPQGPAADAPAPGDAIDSLGTDRGQLSDDQSWFDDAEL